MTIRELYLETARITHDLVADPVVADCWTAPSALRRLRVGALAAHVACQVTQVPPTLDAPAPASRPVSLLEHYRRSTWTDGDIDSELNTGIRLSAEQAAAAGVDTVTADGGAALAELQRRLPTEPSDRVIQLPWGPWALSLDDFLVTRLVELAVHSDDLAVSVGIEPPTLPSAGVDTVLDLLCRMAARRHGPIAVLRALSRAERAPRTIAAL